MAMKEARESAIVAALRFVKGYYVRVVAVSAAMLVPCYWHARIEAGDLGSHAYNAWLAQLVERGQAPGLYLARQWTNVLFDVALLKVGDLVGLGAAEKICVAACVLIFFWGAFAFIAAATKRPPWLLTPGIAMVAYGWTFHMGFMNYYVSTGLALAAVAILWRGRKTDWIMAAVLAAMALIAHPLGLIWLAGVAVYVTLAERMQGALRLLLPVAALLVIYGAHEIVVHRYPTDRRVAGQFYIYNGSDQLAVFGHCYTRLAEALFAAGVATMLFGVLADGKRVEALLACRVPMELWAVSFVASWFLPNTIKVPFYAAPASALLTRLSLSTAVLALCMVGCLKPRTWHLAGLAACGAIFFVWLHEDTGMLNRMEKQASNLLSAVPRGERVTQTVWYPEPSRIDWIGHIADRIMIGRCFAYANYEPVSGQFRVRASPGSGMVADSAADTRKMEHGNYRVRPEDLPMFEICQCDASDRTKLCLHELKAGERNGERCLPPL
jgi:hypothetical protein